MTGAAPNNLVLGWEARHVAALRDRPSCSPAQAQALRASTPAVGRNLRQRTIDTAKEV